VTASVGRPLDLTRFRGAGATAPVLREITDTVMRAVRDQVAAVRDEPAPDEFAPATRSYVDPV
jgi:hypothetical protein